MPVSEQTYHTILLEDPEGHWELVCGRPREKPTMMMAHNEMIDALNWQLKSQLSPRDFAIRANRGRIRTAGGSYFEPDLIVVPRAIIEGQQPNDIEVFREPLPLDVEVWSPSTGDYDETTKLPEYQRRGDAEMWYLRPYERTLTAWRRQTDGEYDEQSGTRAVSLDLPRYRVRG